MMVMMKSIIWMHKCRDGINSIMKKGERDGILSPSLIL